ncbi:SDR family oxidoreductase [Tsukamurella sp. 8F]|uniref:SDR family oxidoreductase n=1 Tax=unclassified Tsukamurella TaxID=2633480 RepID=UPI0023B8F97E|nr:MULTISPECIES: SDR family oxidoreductase [unclassified Tsukamurella]MDF0530209.1 SDR family oxidoreductase [Tsukamurella sp. 8J]MDF0586526.1 SDR family oxidoreductase [Tsukamurella sp. 8F]
MHVFVTGATGWIGSAAVDELLAAGHHVVGLARTAQSAEALRAKGATALRGDLDDLASLRAGARTADAVVHLANKHDWGDPEETDRAERAAVQAMLETLEGTDRPFLIANGLSGLVEGRAAVETDPSPAVGPGSDRGGSENLSLDYADRGVRTMAVRFAPSVHGRGDWGFVNWLVAAARKRGVSGYVGDGTDAWSAVHRGDAARLIRLGLEEAPAGSRLHAVAEESIPTHTIAEAIGETLGLPVQSVDPDETDEHFGVVGRFFGRTMTGSSDLTRSTVGWQPVGPGLVADIRSGAYTDGIDR